MAVMKIRGGDLDLVEYEFPSFPPGENLRTLGLKKEYALSPVPGTVRVRAPSRIHLTVLDMNRFAPDRPGGGGIGFAIQTYCTAEVTCIPSGIEIDYSRKPILRHFIEVFRNVVGYEGGFAISARDHMHEHVGLGSTSTILIAVANALNAAIGSPLTQDQLRLLLGSNYVEETAEGSVAFGFETGVGPAVSTYGGMAIMGDELTLVYRHPFAEGKRVYIAIPPSDISSAGEKEFDLLMNKARTLDYRDRELKSYMVLMDLIPALEQGNLAKIGEIIWEIEFRGSKRAEVEHHGFELYRYMAALRDAGLEFVGMSSVGPSIAVITDRDEADVATVFGSLGLKIAIATEVDNEGLTISLPDH
ncbi:GHMP kinase [Methanoculleus taiwanensis]|uniref:GHMP kinase n=1 Tax=Methanoculleus taiwanensis TaxID=1550565 RepID=A0A498H1Z7_9EURY|nr:GHMP kinase [Methanoculleus taiwanensis]RXE56427.1 GHMP kinase [Methanoculleus taiwanensis]